MCKFYYVWKETICAGLAGGGDDVWGCGFGKVMFKLDVRGRGMGWKRVV